MNLRWKRRLQGVVVLGVPCVLGVFGPGGCSAESYQRSADRQVQEIVTAKHKDVTGREEPFVLKRQKVPLPEVGTPGEVEDLKHTPPPQPIIQPIESPDQAPAGSPPGEPSPSAPPPPAETPPPPAAPPAQDAPGPPAAPSAEAKPALATAAKAIAAPRIPARILTLSDALRVAFANNRDYQTQKESVYLNALGLTLVRWQFAPRFFGLITGNFDKDSTGQHAGSVTTDFGWNQLFANGARLSLSVANNFFQFFTGDRSQQASTLLNGSITQPLLRGFGNDVVLEPLIQAERDVIYQIRAFERFRQTFIVQVASEFYRVLQARNRVSNEYLNWQGLVTNLDRARALAEGQRLPRFEVDQVLQQELQAQDRYAVAVEDYQSSLDRFKITLDFPIDSSLALDDIELEKIKATAQASVEVEVDDAIAAAIHLRLDLQTARDQAEDAVRKVKVAANSLSAQLDLTLSASLPSGVNGAQRPTKFDIKNGTYGAGFSLNLPFDRRAERNLYAASLINVESESRAAGLFEDLVRAGVRDSFRRLLREKETLTIQTASVKLAAARVDSTNALRDAGRAETRDVLESQSALIEAQNALTSALINLAIARLEFASDTGTLWVRQEGRFEERHIPRGGWMPLNPPAANPVSRAEEPQPIEAKNG